MSKFCLFSLATPNIEQIAEISRDHRRQYCMQHGYKMVESKHSLDETKHPVWSKIYGLLKVFQTPQIQSEYFLWMDADTLILNKDFDLQQILKYGNKDTFIWMGQDINGWNNGVFLIKKCQESFRFLNEVLENYEKFKTHKFREQAAMGFLMDSVYKPYRKKVCQVPIRLFNSYLDLPEYKTKPTNLYQEGDFAVHFPGIKNKDKLKNYMFDMLKKENQKDQSDAKSFY